jgi:diamine N-acetyltransferase
LRRVETEDPYSRVVSETLSGMDPWMTLGFSSADLFNYLGRMDGALSRYFIFISEAPAGVVCVRYPWLRGPYLELLALFNSHQGQGIGSQIIGWMEAEARLKSGNLWVLVSSFNPRGRNFYLKLGFSEIATLPALVKPGYDEILLRKCLQCSAS